MATSFEPEPIGNLSKGTVDTKVKPPSGVDIKKSLPPGVVILLKGISGNTSVDKVPEVILLADKFGIRAESNVPEVILLADKFGIRAESSVPEFISLAE